LTEEGMICWFVIDIVNVLRRFYHRTNMELQEPKPEFPNP
jgi:hypothetical protein